MLLQHLAKVGDISLSNVEYAVFDEADILVSMGITEQLYQILAQLYDHRQTLLLSATLPSALAEFAKSGLRGAHIVRLDQETKISPDLKLMHFSLKHEEKPAALLYLLRERISSVQQTLIFVSTKSHVEFLELLFREEGIKASVCFNDMDQNVRDTQVSSFRARNTNLLILTDSASRGIDIPLVDNVFNWDFPATPKLFACRAAKASRTGTAFSFVTSSEMPHVVDLHQAVRIGEASYWVLPPTVLDVYADRIHKIVDASTELKILETRCSKVFGLYTKTKPKPSKESVEAAKILAH